MTRRGYQWEWGLDRPAVRQVRRALFFFALGLSTLVPATAQAREVALEVAEPYLELHTGPGSGFPVFHVVDRGQRIVLKARKTDWYRVMTAKGVEGWASRRELEKTLTDDGKLATFRDTLLEDYLQRHLEVGFSFGAVDMVDPVVTVRVAYRVHKNLAVELARAQSAGDYSSSTFTYLSVVSHPYPDWTFSPFFSLGAGKFRNTPKQTLIGAVESEAYLGNVGIGLNWHLTGRFIVRTEYRRQVVYQDVDRNNEYNELSMGFSFFFF